MTKKVFYDIIKLQGKRNLLQKKGKKKMEDFKEFVQEEEVRIKNSQMKRLNSIEEELFEKYYNKKKSGEDVEEEEHRNPDYANKYYEKRFEEWKKLKKANRDENIQLFFMGLLSLSLIAIIIFGLIFEVAKRT